MINLPKNQKGYYVASIYDDAGRLVIPSAVFTMETRYKLIGIGGIGNNTEASKPMSIGDGLFMFNMHDTVYVGKKMGAVIETPARFTTHAEKQATPDGRAVSIYKRMSFNTEKGIEEKHLTIIDGAQLCLFVPYQTSVRSGTMGGKVYAFLCAEGDLRIGRIPLPNTWEDGALCIGTGVTHEKLPSPDDHMNAVIKCFFEDKYNADLSNDRHYDMKWEWDADIKRYVHRCHFRDCHTILNETLVAILQHM